MPALTLMFRGGADAKRRTRRKLLPRSDCDASRIVTTHTPSVPAGNLQLFSKGAPSSASRWPPPSQRSWTGNSSAPVVACAKCCSRRRCMCAHSGHLVPCGSPARESDAHRDPR
eukprot:4953316-Prymnesium_polylepis.3